MSSYMCKNFQDDISNIFSFWTMVILAKLKDLEIKWFSKYMTKLKNVWNVILKVLTCVRTHPEELLVPKISIFVFFEDTGSRMDFMTI